MSINKELLLSLARESLNNVGEEWTRNSIGRAYYCMYHAAIEIIGGEKNIPKKDDSGAIIRSGVHKRLSAYLCDSGVGFSPSSQQLCKKIGIALRAAHHRRVVSDYDLSMKINRIDAIALIQTTETFLRDCQEINQEIMASEH